MHLLFTVNYVHNLLLIARAHADQTWADSDLKASDWPMHISQNTCMWLATIINPEKQKPLMLFMKHSYKYGNVWKYPTISKYWIEYLVLHKNDTVERLVLLCF